MPWSLPCAIVTSYSKTHSSTDAGHLSTMVLGVSRPLFILNQHRPYPTMAGKSNLNVVFGAMTFGKEGASVTSSRRAFTNATCRDGERQNEEYQGHRSHLRRVPVSWTYRGTRICFSYSVLADTLHHPQVDTARVYTGGTSEELLGEVLLALLFSTCPASDHVTISVPGLSLDGRSEA